MDANLNKLELSFAALSAKHNLTSLAVAYRGEQFGPKYRFCATGHFDDAAEGQIPCASGHGEDIETATRNMLSEVTERRLIALHGEDALYGNDPLEQEAA